MVRGIPGRGSAAQETMCCMDKSGLARRRPPDRGTRGFGTAAAWFGRALASSAHETMNSATCGRQVSAPCCALSPACCIDFAGPGKCLLSLRLSLPLVLFCIPFRAREIAPPAETMVGGGGTKNCVPAASRLSPARPAPGVSGSGYSRCRCVVLGCYSRTWAMNAVPEPCSGAAWASAGAVKLSKAAA